MGGGEWVYGGAGESEYAGDGGVCGVFVGGVEVWGGGGEECGWGVGRGGVFGGVCVECDDCVEDGAVR